MKKFFLLLLMPLCMYVTSCGDGDEISNEGPSQILQESLSTSDIFKDSICQVYFGKGYNEMNVEELKVLGENVPEYGSSVKAWVSFSGFKDNKRWTTVFDRDTRKQLLEYQDKEVFCRKQSIYLGYGESQVVEVSAIYSRIIPLKDGYLLHLFNQCGDFNGYSGYSELFYNGDSIFQQRSNIQIYPWFNNTFIYNKNIFNLKGEGIYSFKDDISLSRGLYLPISSYECISWDSNNIKRQDLSEGYYCREQWSYALPNSYDNDRISISLTNVENDILTFVYEIVHYDGSKEKKQVKLNINGEDLDKVIPVDI